MILAIPTIVLAVGLFLWLQDIDFSAGHLFVVVSVCNAFGCLAICDQNSQYTNESIRCNIMKNSVYR